MIGHVIDAIVIGGSAGSVPVLLDVMPALPAALVVPIIIVVHLPPGPSRFPHLLELACPRTVCEVDDKLRLAPSTIFVGPPNYHLLVERSGELALSVDEPVNFSRPSIDVLFESAAEALGPRVAGVLLSGANDDGADGLARIERAGGIAIVQDPATASAPAMPTAGLARTHHARVAAPSELAELLFALCAKENVR